MRKRKMIYITQASFLKSLRMAKGSTQRSVALAVGISHTTYHRLESGQIEMSISEAHKISEFFQAKGIFSQSNFIVEHCSECPREKAGRKVVLK